MGYAIDRIGRPYSSSHTPHRICLVFSVSIVILGQALFSLSAHTSINSYTLAFCARLLFG